ncbi:hypothetical protein TWF694_011532 [Orbilia ellipsospora]|uniref:Uncharacterized protein n=1 Tax=Orbilia ellipsospora TaxID=2528407 RepID=A0AAV9X6R6_9PEZI
MASGDLNQQFFLGEMPEGLQFKITQVSAWAHSNEGWFKLSGYTTTFTGELPGPWSSLMVHNDHSDKCAGGGATLGADPENDKGKACIVKSNISGEVTKTSGPLKIGTVKFRHTGPRASTSHPGVVKVSFDLIDKESQKPVAKGTIKFSPTKFGEGVSGFFGVFGRPSHLPIEVTWEYGAYGTSRPGGSASINNADIGGIGVDPGPIYLVFKLAEDGETLVVTFVRTQTTLNKIATVGVDLLLKANLEMIQYASGMKGVGMVGKAIKLGIKIGKWAKKNEKKIKQIGNKMSQAEHLLSPEKGQLFRA